MPPKTPSRLALALALSGCGPDTTSATSTETTTSDTAALESESGEHSDTTETGADEDRCGDGVLDPGEDCEPLDSFCDTPARPTAATTRCRPTSGRSSSSSSIPTRTTPTSTGT